MSFLVSAGVLLSLVAAAFLSHQAWRGKAARASLNPPKAPMEQLRPNTDGGELVVSGDAIAGESATSNPESVGEDDTSTREIALARLDRYRDDRRAALASPTGWWSALQEVIHEMGFACLRAGLSKADIVSRLGTGHSSWRRDDYIGISYYPSAMLVFKFDERGTLIDAIDGGRSLRVTMLVREALERAMEREAYRRTVTDQAAIPAGCENLRVVKESVETGGDFVGRRVLEAVYKGRPFEVILEWYDSMPAAFAHVDGLLEFSPTDAEGVEYVVGPNGADGLGDVEIRTRLGASRTLAFIRNNVWVMIPNTGFNALLDELAGELDQAIISQSAGF